MPIAVGTVLLLAAAVAGITAPAAPVHIDWSAYPRAPDSQQRTAAVYSPCHLTLGGEARYLLYTVAVLQQLGYKTDVIVSPGNQCNSSAQLSEVARALRIHLAQDTGFKVAVQDGNRLHMAGHYVSACLDQSVNSFEGAPWRNTGTG